MTSTEQDRGLLTEAEQAVVAARLKDNPDRSEDAVVAEVKSERVGPAVQWEDTPERDEVVVPEIESLRAQLDEASQRRIDAAGNDSDSALREAGRMKSALEEINAYLLDDVEQVFAAQAEAETPDVDVDDASATDLVGHLKDHPGDADAVEEAEHAREGGPRKSVLAAIEKAREAQS